jgi:hypothetical protein
MKAIGVGRPGGREAPIDVIAPKANCTCLAAIEWNRPVPLPTFACDSLGFADRDLQPTTTRVPNLLSRLIAHATSKDGNPISP